MTELVLFASAFATVFLLGFQSLNVNQGQEVAAFVTSFGISLASLVLYKVLPEASWTQCAAYMLGCATGIVSSMRAHRRWKAWWTGYRFPRVLSDEQLRKVRGFVAGIGAPPFGYQPREPRPTTADTWPPAADMTEADKRALAQRLFGRDQWLHEIRKLDN